MFWILVFTFSLSVNVSYNISIHVSMELNGVLVHHHAPRVTVTNARGRACSVEVDVGGEEMIGWK